MITIYTKDHCVQCSATIRKMDALGISYEKKDATQYAESLKSLGFMQTPVVITDDDKWSGYRPDKIERLR